MSVKETAKTFETLPYAGVQGIELPDPAIVNYWKDREERICWIDDKIDDDAIGLVRNILRWNMEDRGIAPEKRQPIKIYINSPGGLLTTTFAICDAIRMSKTPVWAINVHEACSAAALIFITCHRRAACENAYFLLHLGSGGTGGTFQQSRAQQADYDHKIRQMIHLFKESLEISEEDYEEFEKNIDGEWYLYMDVRDGSKADARRFNLITDEIKDLYWHGDEIKNLF